MVDAMLFGHGCILSCYCIIVNLRFAGLNNCGCFDGEMSRHGQSNDSTVIYLAIKVQKAPIYTQGNVVSVTKNIQSSPGRFSAEQTTCGIAMARIRSGH